MVESVCVYVFEWKKAKIVFSDLNAYVAHTHKTINLCSVLSCSRLVPRITRRWPPRIVCKRATILPRFIPLCNAFLLRVLFLNRFAGWRGCLAGIIISIPTWKMDIAKVAQTRPGPIVHIWTKHSRGYVCVCVSHKKSTRVGSCPYTLHFNSHSLNHFNYIHTHAQPPYTVKYRRKKCLLCVCLPGGNICL